MSGEKMQFMEDEQNGDHNLYSGIKDYLSVYTTDGDVREIVTRTLAEELDRVSAPRQIDYLSLDTEGNP
jgi:hypothetical protein